MESRIKQLREKRGLIQEILAAELGITQQMLSKYERDVTLIKVDILKKIATYFNVTTDYLLGVSDVKRDLQRQMKMNETLDEYYDLIEFYGKLNEIENSLKVCKISFLRVHQSFLVNYKHIKGQSYDFVVMDNGKKISISEDRRKLISEQYCSMEDTYYVDR